MSSGFFGWWMLPLAFTIFAFGSVFAPDPDRPRQDLGPMTGLETVFRLGYAAFSSLTAWFIWAFLT